MVEYAELLEFLRREGTAEVPHSEVGFMAHLVGVHDVLVSWGCSETVCFAGLFHSIYGSEGFGAGAVELRRRPEIRALVGTAAERLAFVNSAMTYDSFDTSLREGPPYRVVDRFNDAPIELTEPEFADLSRIQLADWLEQVERFPESWDYRRQAYRAMAERLGGQALAAYDEVFSLEPQPDGR